MHAGHDDKRTTARTVSRHSLLLVTKITELLISSAADRQGYFRSSGANLTITGNCTPLCSKSCSCPELEPAWQDAPGS